MRPEQLNHPQANPRTPPRTLCPDVTCSTKAPLLKLPSSLERRGPEVVILSSRWQPAPGHTACFGGDSLSVLVSSRERWALH